MFSEDTAFKIFYAFISLYEEGKLNANFNKTKNKMEADPQVERLMEQIFAICPERKKPKDAAAAMRDLPTEDATQAIAASTNVVDKRKLFTLKMAQNGGARGILEGVMKALEVGDTATSLELLSDAQTLFSLDLENIT